MAGGIGSKLWPLSRKKSPKQFLPIFNGKSLFQLNVEALLLRYTPSDIFVSISEDYLNYVRTQAPILLEENYIIEPKLNKDTGPASGYAMLKVARKYPNEVVMFYVQPVVIRTPAERYVQMIENIEELVKLTGKLVTGGIYPKFADIGSDLIKIDKNERVPSKEEVYRISEFLHVVNANMNRDELKRKYLNGEYIIHCNHYTWKPQELLAAFKQFKPDWYDTLVEIESVLGTQNEYEKVKQIYDKFEAGRIELVTEHLFNSNKALAVILPFEWEHITTWENIYQYFKRTNTPLANCKTVSVDSNNNLIFTEKTKTVATIDVKNYVIVDMNDVLFICPRSKIFRIKELVNKLEEGEK